MDALERAQVAARRTVRSVQLMGRELPVARGEDLVIMKALAMRPRDIADIEGLVELCGATGQGQLVVLPERGRAREEVVPFRRRSIVKQPAPKLLPVGTKDSRPIVADGLGQALNEFEQVVSVGKKDLPVSLFDA